MNGGQSEYDILTLEPGTKLAGGRVIVQDILGGGGFGVTYKAVHQAFGEVALKEFLPRSMIYSRQGNTVSIRRDKAELYETCKHQFMRESRILRRLQHPNIVRVLDDFEENGTAYYVMELLDGEDLGTYVGKRGTPLDPAEACEYLTPIMEAVEYLHSYENKVLHRDISPDNILLCRTAVGVKPCLIDFGAAFSAQKDFTQTFPRVRKNGYSPIEQNWGPEDQGTWSDVYSMAATYYFAVTGSTPVPASERGVGDNDALKRPGSISPAVPKALDDVLMHALALDYTQRIRQMSDLRQEIVSATEKGSGAPPPGTGGGKAEEETERGSNPPSKARSFFALLLDWLICWAMPAMIITSFKSPEIGVIAGASLSVVINGLLVCVSRGGTVGQRLLNCPVSIPNPLRAMLYSLLRHIVPIALLDELIALICSVHFIQRLAAGRAGGKKKRSALIPQLRCIEGVYRGEIIGLKGMDSLVIGRGADTNLSYPDTRKSISKHHCAFIYESDGWHVKDLNSKSGTSLNRAPLTPLAISPRLQDGDQIALADKELFVYEEIGADSGQKAR